MNKIISWVVAGGVVLVLVVCGGVYLTGQSTKAGIPRPSVPTSSSVSQAAVSSDSEVINNITVPHEPDESVNDATIAGVDMNKNGVRDDVERVIAKKVLTQKDFETIMRMAGAVQQILLISSPTKAQLDPLWKSITCSSGVGDVDYYKPILTATLNTEVRKSNYSGKMSGYGGTFVSLSDCSK